MKEKLGVAMIASVSLSVLILLLTLLFPELINDGTDVSSFTKGIASCLVCCAAGLIFAFKHDKRTCSDERS